MQLIVRTLSLSVIALVIAACGTSVNIENGELVVNSNFSITETMLNSGDSTDVSFGQSDFIRNAEFDIQEGQIVVSGNILCQDSTRSDGSITITMNATENGFIDVQITDVQADCTYDDSVITQAQEEIENSLSEAARGLEDADATINFTEVSLTDDALTLSLEVRAPLNGGNNN